MPTINWNLLGPVLGAVVIILGIVFGFIVKMRKMDRRSSTPAYPPPVNPGTLDKKTLCFNHESRISSNETATEMINEQLNRQEEQNTTAHNRIYDKMQDSETKIINAIKKNNG